MVSNPRSPPRSASPPGPAPLPPAPAARLEPHRRGGAGYGLESRLAPALRLRKREPELEDAGPPLRHHVLAVDDPPPRRGPEQIPRPEAQIGRAHVRPPV